MDVTIHQSSLAACFFLCAPVTFAAAHPSPQVAPANGMRESDPGPQAIVGAKVIVKPGTVLERATVLVSNGRIEAVGGAELAIPAGYRTWNCEGLTLYAAFVEPALLLDSAPAQAAAAASKGAHWNRKVTPQVSVSDLPPLTKETRDSLRSLGFATAQLLPEDGIFRGSGEVILLDDNAARAKSLKTNSCQFIATEYGGAWENATYPGALIGALALQRQTIRDARWFEQSSEAWRTNPSGNEPPIDATALAALAPFANGSKPILLDATDEKDLLREARVAKELGLAPMLLGSGTEFRRIEQFQLLGAPLLVPVRYPRTPDVVGIAKSESLGLRDLMTWELAPTNAARLAKSNVRFAFTSAKLEDRKDFRANVRVAIEHGLAEDVALAAVTSTPAELLGLASSLGTIEAGKLANVVLVDGAIFGDDEHEPGPIRAVWVAGKRHDVDLAPVFSLEGRCQLVMEGRPPMQGEVNRKEQTLTLLRPDGTRTVVRPFRIDGDRFACTLDGAILGREGSWRASGVAIGMVADGRAEAADGSSIAFRLEHVDASPLDPEKPEDAAKKAEQAKVRAEALAAKRALSERPLPFPFGEYGLAKKPVQQTVLVQHATIWTEGQSEILKDSDLLIEGGKITAIGRSLAAPEGALVIDATGRHVTPGLIDCHSHTGIDGGVNEWTQANTAETWIGDVIDPEAIGWYRELAGGLVAVNQLHGSANPIGGRNSVIKIRWGEDESAFPIAGAKPGIKFALGENPVRSNGRYPDTRMGVEMFLRDAFDSAKSYDQQQNAWAKLSDADKVRIAAPRPDLELEVVAEILRGDRIIHCHSYRQDEILMLLRMAEGYGFRIGTLQHVLEGYKVADVIAKHGAGASSFSDWWAYKMEVYDAIPHNGAILERTGVVTSFNSDSDEVVRRLNTEAAKAVRYGGLSPHEALKLVTLNPAKQLRIDEHMGSLEVGKDGDFVIWSGDPLSVYTRADETWIDGIRRFSRVEDATLAESVRVERERLLAKALDVRDEDKAKAKKEREKSDTESERMDDAKAPPKRGLLARMLDTRENWYFEVLRRGGDPTAARPGDCGCGAINGGGR